MKTAMQEFIEWLEKSSNVQNDILNWELVKENALEKEKEQIENAFEYGYIDAIADPENFGSGKGYIIKIYNQNK